MRGRFGWIEVSHNGLSIWVNGSLDEYVMTRLFKPFENNDYNIREAYAYLNTSIKSIRGNFAIIAKSEKWVFAACDKVKSIQISYILTKDKEIIIGDHAPLLFRNAHLKKDDIDIDSFLQIAMSGYCTRSNTLYKDVYQLNAGESIMADINSKLLLNEYYYTYSPWKVNNSPSRKKLIDEFSEVCLETVNELIDSADERQIAIPLSAGNDSRLIASLLYEKGYKNVICFSYGKTNNFEVKTAGAIAEKLNYKWINIPCSIGSQKLFFKSSLYSEYLSSFDTYSSVVAVHDVAFISHLYENNLISNEAIIVNGNSGDFISGGHISEYKISNNLNINDNIKSNLPYFLDKHYSLWSLLRNKHNDSRITQELLSVADDRSIIQDVDVNSMHGYFEFLEYAGRQTQYVTGQQRAYDFFDYEWRLPLWSEYFLDFWEKVPVEYKTRQNLYVDTLRKNNWGGGWRSYPVNKQKITPPSLRVTRNFLKILLSIAGKNSWHNFDRKVFHYWTDVSCNTAITDYHKVLADKNGYRNYISWVVDEYFRNHNLSLKSLKSLKKE